MTGAAVRPATLDDGPALTAVDALTWNDDVSPAPMHREPFFERIDVGTVLVADDDSAPAGYAIAGPARPEIPSHAHVWQLLGLAVHPDHGRRGLGRALVTAAVDRARAAGAAKITLRVLGPNAGARALYRGCGFSDEGVLIGEFLLDGTPVDDVIMARHLL